MSKRDWKNKAHYEFTKDLDLPGWAWEFLRRNPEYQKDWAKELANYRKTNPSALIEDDGFFIESSLIDCSAKWGLFYWVNPETDFPIMCFFNRGDGRIYSQTTEIKLSPGHAAAIFNLARPIEPQISRIRQGLMEHQRRMALKDEIKIKRPRRRKNVWCNYLRILDATNKNVKKSEIASVIFNKYDNVHPDYVGNRHVIDSLKAAQKLMRGGYLEII